MPSLPKENEKLYKLPMITLANENHVAPFSCSSQLSPASDTKSDAKLGTCTERCAALYTDEIQMKYALQIAISLITYPHSHNESRWELIISYITSCLAFFKIKLALSLGQSLSLVRIKTLSFWPVFPMLSKKKEHDLFYSVMSYTLRPLDFPEKDFFNASTVLIMRRLRNKGRLLGDCNQYLTVVLSQQNF